MGAKVSGSAPGTWFTGPDGEAVQISSETLRPHHDAVLMHSREISAVAKPLQPAGSKSIRGAAPPDRAAYLRTLELAARTAVLLQTQRRKRQRSAFCSGVRRNFERQGFLVLAVEELRQGLAQTLGVVFTRSEATTTRSLRQMESVFVAIGKEDDHRIVDIIRNKLPFLKQGSAEWNARTNYLQTWIGGHVLFNEQSSAAWTGTLLGQRENSDHWFPLSEVQLFKVSLPSPLFPSSMDHPRFH